VRLGAGDLCHFVGDSITEGSLNEGGYSWPTAPGGLWDTVNATWSTPPSPVQVFATASGATSISTGAPATVLPTAVTGKHVVFSKWGAIGATAIELAAAMDLAIYSWVPASLASPVIVLEIGINDVFDIFSATETIGQFITAYTAILSGILGRNPGARIVCVSCMCSGELWLTSGPSWDPSNPWDTQLIQVNNAIQTIIAGLANPNVIYLDIRAPLLAWEVTHNPQPPAAGNVGFIPNGAGGTPIHPMIVAMTQVLAPAFLALVPVTP
jgi:GDSL-like Lipase/Acylhydrolase family